MSGSGQRLFQGFGMDFTEQFPEGYDSSPAPVAQTESTPYMGPGSPGYNYATPDQQAVQDVAAAYTGPAYSDPNRSYVGAGTVNTSYQEERNAGSSQSVDSGPGIFDRLFGTGASQKTNETGIVGTLVNIFGQLTGRNGQPIPPPPPQPSVPIWVWLAVPVVLVGGVLLVRSKPRSAAVAGYRRRKSRR